MKVNYTKLTIINYVYLVILELLFKFFVMQTIDIGILYILIFTMPISILFTFLMSLSKKPKVNKIVGIIIWSIVCFIFAAETVYFSFYKAICGLSALSYGGQVMEFFDAILEHIKAHIVLLGTDVLLCLTMIIIGLKKVSFKRFEMRNTVILFTASIVIIFSSLMYNKNNNDSSYYLFYETNDLISSTNRFGLLGAVSLDAVKYLSNFEENIMVVKKVRKDYTTDATTEYNITNIVFDALINKTNDSNLKNMHAYFASQEATNKNKYTGIFAGKNLVFITAEGFYPIAVDKELTPTLYKLSHEGFEFTNYYQPIYNCSTSDGEFVNLLSILPGVSLCSLSSTKGNYYPYNIGSIFKNYDYNTYAFHGWTYSYYDRDKTHPNLGFNYYGYDTYKTGFKNALKGIDYAWPTSDIQVMNSSYDIYAHDDNFIAYYMSISGHLQYNFGNAMAAKNKTAVESLKARDAIKAYIATQIEFDKSLKILLDNLERDGKLKDTVIVISADHYPYGLTNDDIQSYVDWMKNPNFDLYKNTLIIYNSEIKHTVVDKYIGSIDVLPTILNMFGVKYDSRLLMGTDIFSDSKDLVIFNNKSWITDKGRYDYLKKKFEAFTDEEVSQEYIDEINEIVKLKFQMSKSVISKDYYRKVLG